MLSVEMVRRYHMVPDTAIPNHEVVGHYSWEFVIIDGKEIVKTGFARYSEAENYIRAEEYASASNKQLEMVALDWQRYKYGYWRRIGDQMECHSVRKTIPTGFIPKENAVICEVPNSEYGFIYHITVRILGWETRVVHT